VSDLVNIRNGQIERFDPQRHRLQVAAIDYGIEEAKRIKDWPSLETAVDAKIEEQRKFMAWWKATVIGSGTRTDLNRVRGEGLSMRDAEHLTGMKQQRVSDLGKRLEDIARYRLHLLGAEFRAAMLEALENVRGTQGTGENEWFTPPEYIEMARSVLGEIDLDPATHEQAQAIIQAKHFFTKADDSLAQRWHGRVWLNPPYAQPLIAQFVAKMVAEVEARHVSAGIMLTHNYTDTAWFQAAAAVADAICFTRGRVKFYEPDGAIAAPTQGQAFFILATTVKHSSAALSRRDS
jgi:ParB family chromosome partitioning protein